MVNKTGQARSLLEVAGLLEQSIPAELNEAVEVLIQRINNLSASSGDVEQLMEALPPLVNVARYGNVRNTDTKLLLNIVYGLVTRICIGLPNAVNAIDEEASQKLVDLVAKINEAISLLQADEAYIQWHKALQQISSSQNAAPLVAGYSTRLLFDNKLLVGEELTKRFYFRMSQANDPGTSASWLEGFLKGSGTILLVDNELWSLVNQWVDQLEATNFNEVLPLLRRTFSHFTQPERRKLGEKLRSGGTSTGVKLVYDTGIDASRGKRGLPVVLQLLGLTQTTDNNG